MTVITVAPGFPTTVAPIIQINTIPVFIDADPITGNGLYDQLEIAYRKGKVKAGNGVLGNPFDMSKDIGIL